MSMGVLQRIRNTRFTFARPRCADVVIYDEEGADELVTFLDPSRVIVLDLSGRTFNIWVLIGTVVRGGRSMHDYAIRFLSHVKPRLVLTLIDTTPFFYRIKNTHPQIVVASIQNGWRGKECEIDFTREATIGPLSADHVFCFGETSARLYRSLIDVNPVVIGSFRSNHVPVKPRIADDLVALISTIRPKVDLDRPVLDYLGKPTVDYRTIYRRRHELAGYVANFCVTNNLRLRVVGKDMDPTREAEFYDRAFAHSPVKWEFIPRSTRLGSYPLIDDARIVVSSSSSLGYEALARGHRSAFFMLDPEVTGNFGDRFAWPEAFDDRGPFWTNFLDESVTMEILEFLHRLEDDAWRELRKQYVPQLISADPGNTKLRQFFETMNVGIEVQEDT